MEFQLKKGAIGYIKALNIRDVRILHNSLPTAGDNISQSSIYDFINNIFGEVDNFREARRAALSALREHRPEYSPEAVTGTRTPTVKVNAAAIMELSLQAGFNPPR